MDMSAVTPASNYTGTSENSEMVTDFWLIDSEPFDEIGNAMFSLGEKFQDLNPGDIAQGLEGPGILHSSTAVHDVSSVN